MFDCRGALATVVALCLLPCGAMAAPAAPHPRIVHPTLGKARMEIRAVVVTAYELGKDTGDAPGEFQAWAEHFPTVLPFAGGPYPLRYDPVRKVLAVCTGMGTSEAGLTIQALGLDPRFDLSHAYWLVAATAGIDPQAGTLGSAVWVGDVVDTDWVLRIDDREVPQDWPTGILPRGRGAPYQAPATIDRDHVVFPLDKGLRDWAYGVTQDVVLPDNDALRARRAPYAAFAKAAQPPKVTRGDEATGMSLDYGKRIQDHYRNWVRYWTGRDDFAVKAMEDSGIAAALARLKQQGRADPQRLLVLRAGSEFTVMPTAADPVAELHDDLAQASAFETSAGRYAALASAYLVANRVLDRLSGGWSTYRGSVPGHRGP
jgi:purine nucleoside permease